MIVRWLTLTIFGQLTFGQLTLEKIPIHLFPLLGDDMNPLQFFQNPIYLTLDDTINYNIYIMLSRKSSLDDDWDTPSVALEWTDVDNVDTTSIYSSTLYFLSGQSHQWIKLYNEMVMICDQEIEQSEFLNPSGETSAAGLGPRRVGTVPRFRDQLRCVPSINLAGRTTWCDNRTTTYMVRVLNEEKEIHDRPSDERHDCPRCGPCAAGGRDSARRSANR